MARAYSGFYDHCIRSSRQDPTKACEELVKIILKQGLATASSLAEDLGDTGEADGYVCLCINGCAVTHVRSKVLELSAGLKEMMPLDSLSLDAAYDAVSVRLVFSSLSAGTSLFAFYTGHVDSLFHCVQLMNQYMMPVNYILDAVACFCERIAEAEPKIRLHMYALVEQIIHSNKASTNHFAPLMNACAKSLANLDEPTLNILLRAHTESVTVEFIESVLKHMQDKVIFESTAPPQTPTVVKNCCCGISFDLNVGLEADNRLVLRGRVSTPVHVQLIARFSKDPPQFASRKSTYKGNVIEHSPFALAKSNPEQLAGTHVGACAILSTQSEEVIVYNVDPARVVQVEIRLVRRAPDAGSSAVLAYLCPDSEDGTTVGTVFKRFHEKLQPDSDFSAGAHWRESLTWTALQRWALLNFSATIEHYLNEDIEDVVQRLYRSANFADHPLRLRLFYTLVNCALKADTRGDSHSPDRIAGMKDAITTCAASIPDWSSHDVKFLTRGLQRIPRERWLQLPFLEEIAVQLENRMTRRDKAELIFYPQRSAPERS
jgi:hypothetical protein